jgi:hypothetical protein
VRVQALGLGSNVVGAIDPAADLLISLAPSALPSGGLDLLSLICGSEDTLTVF